MLNAHGLSGMIVGEIRRLNSQKHGFATQNRMRAEHTPFWGVFCALTGLGEKFHGVVDFRVDSWFYNLKKMTMKYLLVFFIFLFRKNKKPC